MLWLKPLTTRGEASAGDNNDTQVAWLQVVGGNATRAQIAESRKIFAAHLDYISRSLAGYHTADYTLPDGSKLRIVSNSGIHNAALVPTGPKPKEKLPHGFLVVSNWARRCIFKRRTSPAVNWKPDASPVPQGAALIESDNQVFRALTGSTYVTHSMVLTDTTPRALWDYTKRGVTNPLASSSTVMPINLNVGSAYKPGLVHYGTNNVVYDKAGTALYTMALSPAILLVDPESPVHAVPNTTSDGSALVLQHLRYAVTSPSTGVYSARFANERLVRASETAYTLQLRNVNTVAGPIGAAAPSSGTFTATLGETVTNEIFLKYGTIGPGGVGGNAGFYNWVSNFVYDIPHDLESQSTITQNAFSEIGNFTASASTSSNLLAVPAGTSVEYPSLTATDGASGSVLWRGGFYAKGTGWPGGIGSYSWSAWYGVWNYRKDRTDTEYAYTLAPSIKFAFNWADISLFNGNGEGLCTGGTHTNTRTYGRSQAQWDGNYLANTYIFDFHPAPIYTDPPWNGDYAAFDVYASDVSIKPELIAMLADYPPTLSGPGTQETTTVKDVRPVNTGSYDYTSRYYIDFDNRGQFYAAIKVRVTCSGAEWRENRAVWDGFMAVHANPSYTIEIALETRWKDIVNSTVLATASGTRPAFEFVTLNKQNPYYFLFPLLTDRQTMNVRVPPTFGLPIAALSQFMTLCGHQGASTALACEDIRADLAPELDGLTRSTDGIEFSTWDGKVITPHRKYVTGQLYARTFKLSDFPDSLWLLASTKCDAKENNGSTGASYFYFPTLPNIIANEVFHVEVRDGVHELWSDELPTTEVAGVTVGAIGPRPDPEDRDIKLYRV